MLKEVLVILAGVFKFWDDIKGIISRLQKTPAEKQRQVIADVYAAFDKANAIDAKTGKPTDDTSDIERIINR